MPRYYFVVTQNDVSVLDQAGLELSGIDAAWDEATKTASQLSRDIQHSLTVGSEWSIEVLDESQRPLRKLSITATGLG
jgi:hypothetical protein